MDEKYGVVATPVLHLMKKSIRRMFILLIIFITLFVISVIDSIYQRCRVIGILERIEVVEETVTEQYEINADRNNNFVGGDNNGEIKKSLQNLW